ncbi:hypothetical protein HN51_044227 [Arachis hypogaea]
MAVDTGRLLVRTSRTMARTTPPPPRSPNWRSSLSTAANLLWPSPYSSSSPLAFSASTSRCPPPNSAASSSHALSPIFSSSICKHAYSLSQNLEPISEGLGVLQFKTGLISVIKDWMHL